MKTSLQALDWERLCAVVAREAESRPGRELLLHARPYLHLAACAEATAAVKEAASLLGTPATPSFAGIDDLAPLLQRARQRSGGLDGKELAQIAQVLKAGEFVRLRMRSRRDLPRLMARATALADLSVLVQGLEASIDAAGQVLDDALPDLRTARREAGVLERSVRDRALEVAARSEWRPLLRDGPPVVRDGRYMLAVKADARGRVPGILHDRSTSGETAFVEPAELVEPQNRLADARAKVKRLVDRVLLERTRELLRMEGEIAETQRQLASLDAVFGRARYGVAIHGTLIELETDAKLRLVRARHPLLIADGRDVVPFDLVLGDRFDALVISGPNTGGKTATLKGIGLIAAMALAAIPAPVDAGSTLPWFDEVHADIGDEQDLAQSLSTFSGHLRRIADVLARATAKSLVLLDELGTGTEPKEGEALGRALLLHLLERGCKVVATTHLSGLKDLGFSVPRVENASLEFDAATLQPLYRLTLGLPGESNALKIARRLGIPLSIVERAEHLLRAGLGEEAGKAADHAARARRAALDHLENAEQERQRAGEARVELEQRIVALEEKARLLEAEKEREIERALREAQEGGLRLLAELGTLPAGLEARGTALRKFLEGLTGRSSLHERRHAWIVSRRKDDAVWLPRYRERCIVRKVDREKQKVTVLYRGLPLEVSFDEVALPDEVTR